MIPRFRRIYLKIIVGILMPVFVLGLFPNYSYALDASSSHKVHIFAITTNDPYFTADSSQEDKQWYLPKTRVPEAWDYSKGSSSVIIAIVDTGIHASHIELNDGRVIGGFNTITNVSIPANSDSDDNGHGTAVAGVVGAVPNNGRGIAGINWNIKLMPIKALMADGTGNISSVAAGIVWAADHGANIINLSIGGEGFGLDQVLTSAITYAYNKGVLIVAAAGNDLSENGLNLDNSSVYPICADNGMNMVLGVAATDVNDQKASFSNFGSNCVDITAPGKKILTSAYLPSDPSDNILIYGSGTSLATPIVSGIAALFKASNPNLSNVEIRDLLMKTSDNIDAQNLASCNGSSCVGFIGKGRVNAYNYFTPKPIQNGALVRDPITNTLYFVLNGMKRSVSAFVLAQRGFGADSIIIDNTNQLNGYITGPPLLPLDGTLIKSVNDPTVYVINQEVKRPLTYLVFLSRGYSFANVQTLSDVEVASYTIGEWYWPPDGTLILIKGNPLVYVMDKQVRRPTTYFVFIARGLSFSKVIAVTEDEFSHVPKPQDQYWLPPQDGTLVKSINGPGVSVIENGTKRLLSYNAFVARDYRFSSVKDLPQAEIDVMTPGTPIE